MDVLQQFLTPFVNIELLLFVAAGTLAGIFVGAIPGLSVTMAVALLLSLTYSWDLLPALALMLGIYYGGVFGGSRAAILVNMPGSPSSVATSFDGYPLSQRGEARMALTLTTIFSFLGGLVGVAVLATAAPLVSSIAIQFGQRDYFLLAMLGLLLIGSLSQGSMAKGMFSAGAGIILGLVGMDTIGGGSRFTFGSLQLMNGIDFVVAILGLFGMSEILYQLKTLNEKGQTVTLKKMAFPPLRFLLGFLPLSMRVSVMGVLIGALPGAGGEIASLLSYDHARRTTKNPKRSFGKGAYEGVIAPEAGNNSAIGGALIPMLTLGIPGDAVTAIFIGALFIHGLQPGPMLMEQSGDLFWVMVGSSVLANIFLLIFGLLVVGIFVRVVTIPKQILLPIIAVITVIGAYALNNSMTDVYWMLGFGFVGFFMKVYQFSVAPLVLGLILGPLIDSSFRRAYMTAQEPGAFLIGFVNNPISLLLTLAFCFTLFSQTKTYQKMMASFKKKQKVFRK
ncbi:putative tricarboxylic transport membrane protein [Alteribacillus persepolensis]|uniref:Putative tricarboxylic transport membrane protein n=1 Tax=Alteribacillus persepolensis TaxID=568899 RepID=A0A1G8AZZ9_9BACI|nr:tripartite tricarboxylate transporter permease [Alteribacillus persepolensis]SDH26474.1 putative tricarboxylic transport membrane protein [Alteribacillus persepolensis]